MLVTYVREETGSPLSRLGAAFSEGATLCGVSSAVSLDLLVSVGADSAFHSRSTVGGEGSASSKVCATVLCVLLIAPLVRCFVRRLTVPGEPKRVTKELGGGGSLNWILVETRREVRTMSLENNMVSDFYCLLGCFWLW